ncbi:hypothetical protein IWX90DRAFT_423942 [Phyllosticta citrichinensis]|uniref:gamma-glutamylcyclotransferase n=1 Tax=Phyllosticta citrichinensis TaxID=1130410 RepID=A0ABR1Y2F2_9PEZI
MPSSSDVPVNRFQASRGRLRKTCESILWGQRQDHTAADPLPKPSQARRKASLAERPLDLNDDTISNLLDTHELGRTVLYLAYGSNLCHRTFEGTRGVKPLAKVNVVVPELRLTFDLPGIPYIEPCFANSGRRNPDSGLADATERTPLVRGTAYHKDRWEKGLVGVVYEVTAADYANIIATEGGGAAYQDVLVDCYALTDPDAVPEEPESKPFRAHTLFSPPQDSKRGGGFQRPDTSYAQPSARYLKLITDGAEEHGLPQDYREYLLNIRPYTITSLRQKVGRVAMVLTWVPVLRLLLSLQEILKDDKGKSPKWLASSVSFVFKSIWITYDAFFKKLFGDGERTIEQNEETEKSSWAE